MHELFPNNSEIATVIRECAGIMLEPASLVCKQYEQCWWVCYQSELQESESKYTNEVEDWRFQLDLNQANEGSRDVEFFINFSFTFSWGFSRWHPQFFYRTSHFWWGKEGRTEIRINYENNLVSWHNRIGQNFKILSAGGNKYLWRTQASVLIFTWTFHVRFLYCTCTQNQLWNASLTYVSSFRFQIRQLTARLIQIQKLFSMVLNQAFVNPSGRWKI